MPKKLTTEEFIEKAKLTHRDIYEYHNVNYINRNTHVAIFCKKHNNIFMQRPADHINGSGCPLCYNERRGDTRVFSKEEFVQKANLVHGNKYNYNNSKYKNCRTKIVIFCNKHQNYFSQTPNSHINHGSGCPACGTENQIETVVSEYRDEFIIKANKIHNNAYEYIQSEYTGNKNKISIFCKKHKIMFMQIPNSHLMGKGCSICKESKGEKEVAKILLEKNILFKREHKFPDCKYKNVLPFDFYIPNINTCIEFQGAQHYEPLHCRGGEEEFKLILLRDSIKQQYCKDKNINLILIKFNENIEKVISAHI